MMKRLQVYFRRLSPIPLILLPLILSCGHRAIQIAAGGGQSVKTPGEAKISREEFIERAQTKARAKLQEMVAEAKKLGPDAEEYLGANLFLKASQASLAGDYESSVLVYESILQLSQDPYIVLKYGMDLIRSGKVADALLVLEKHYPQSDHYREKFGMLLGGIYYGRKQGKLAAQIYRGVLKKNPHLLEACLFLSKIHLQDKRVGQAFSVIKKCQRDNPQKGILFYHQGKLHLSLGEIQKAQQSFLKSLKVEPTFYQSTLALGLIWEDQGNTLAAISAYKKLLGYWPTNRVILSHLVQSLFSIEKYDEVVEYAQHLVFLDPSNLNLKVKLAILHSERKHYSKAIKLLQEVAAEVPESDKVLYYLAAIHQEIKEYEKAIGFFSKISKESELYMESSIQIARMLRARAISDQGEKSESRLMNFIAERSQINSQMQVELQVIKGQYYEFSNRIEEGIAAIEGVASLPEFTDAQKYYLATLQDRVENYKRSITLVEEVLQNDAQNAHAWNFIGYSYLEREVEMAKAFTYISKAVELRPKDGNIRDSLGWYFYKMGKLDAALKELKLAHELAGSDGTITKHLALVYEALNRYDLAKDFYVKTLGLVKAQSEKDEILQFIDRLNILEKQGRYPASHPSSQ